MTRGRRSLFALAACFLLAACAEPEVGTKERPFAMYFVPSVDARQVAAGAEPLTAFVARAVSRSLYQRDEGFFVRAEIPASYIAVVEAFGTGQADFAALNTFSYILARDVKRYPIEAMLTVVREGGERNYQAAIYARTDSGLDSIEALAGRRFAYADPASTSGYILPKRLFEENGVVLGSVVFAQKHDNVIAMVYQKQVDAGAAFYSPPLETTVAGRPVLVYRDARVRVKTQFPDVFERVRIIGYTQDIPNEPWVIRQALFRHDPNKEAKVRQAVTQALLEYAESGDGRKTLKNLYDLEGLVPIDDAAYAGIRALVLDTRLDLPGLLRGK